MFAESPSLFLALPVEPEPLRNLTPEQADKLPHLHRLLLGHYGQPKPRELWDPLTQLI
jgi:endonuclease-3